MGLCATRPTTDEALESLVEDARAAGVELGLTVRCGTRGGAGRGVCRGRRRKDCGVRRSAGEELRQCRAKHIRADVV